MHSRSASGAPKERSRDGADRPQQLRGPTPWPNSAIHTAHVHMYVYVGVTAGANDS